MAKVSEVRSFPEGTPTHRSITAYLQKDGR